MLAGTASAEDKKDLAKIRFIKRAKLAEHDFSGCDAVEESMRGILEWIASKTPEEVQSYREEVWVCVMCVTHYFRFCYCCAGCVADRGRCSALVAERRVSAVVIGRCGYACRRSYLRH